MAEEIWRWRNSTGLYSLLSTMLTIALSNCGGSKRPFISVKAGREKITNYEQVIPIILSVTGNEDPYPQEMVVDINSSSHAYQLSFQLNQNFQYSSFVSVMIDGNHNKVVDKHKYPNCYYSGKVKDHPNWTASMTACHGLQAEFGNMEDEDNYFHLEPLSKTDASMNQMHAFYKQSEYSTKEKNYGCNSGASQNQRENRISHQQVSSVQTKYVEFVAVNDNAQFIAFGRSVTNTVQRTLSIANGMNNLYIKGFNIRVVLTMVVTFTAGNHPLPVASNASFLLDSFEVYANDASGGLGNITWDNAMLLTGLQLDGNTIGLAYLGTMCTTVSVGLSQDGGMPLNMVIATAVHEMGHNFNMLHDDGRNCNCPDNICIMAATSASTSPIHFSDCSASDLSMISGQLSCLHNVPTVSQAGPRCGNGIIEDNETCDCGEPDVCTNPCCDSSTCNLESRAECAHGVCCNTSTCQILAGYTVCRAGTGECDITEYCTGSSNECPKDYLKLDGSPCASDTGYCFNGTCPTHRAQCSEAWDTTEGIICYRFNVDGDFSANCGSNLTNFLPCSERNVFCGQLQCQGGNYKRSYNTAGFIASFGVGNVTCNSYGVQPSSGILNPGLVNDGTKCDTNKVCIEQECQNLTTLIKNLTCPVGNNGLICSGVNVGICNHLGLCSCLPGYAGLTCDSRLDIPTFEAMRTDGTTIGQSSTVGVLTNVCVLLQILSAVLTIWLQHNIIVCLKL